jgi:hypothetical protein
MTDFTKGDAIPMGADHDWTLGATGARGWIFCDKMVTTDARQIALTKVEQGSPAEGILGSEMLSSESAASRLHPTRAPNSARRSPPPNPRPATEN